jgi:hypothetical protein
LPSNDFSLFEFRSKFLTNLRRSASAASAPGIVIVTLDDEAALYFLTNGLHNFNLTNNSKIVFAKILIIGAIGGGKKLKNSPNNLTKTVVLFYLPSQ